MAQVATRSSLAAAGDSCSSQRAPFSISNTATMATATVVHRMAGVGFDARGLRR
jgi:hypothetical protein